MNGSEVAYDLDQSSGPTIADREFFNNFLKADYSGDDANSYTINGIAGTFLEGLTFFYGDTVQGSPYIEDYPDYVTVTGGSVAAAQYQNGLIAATVYTGTFPPGTNSGAVVFLGIPFETIHTKANRDLLMTKVLHYFGIMTSVPERNEMSLPLTTSLEQNYPNPFNPATTFRFSIVHQGPVSLKLYDILGKEVATIAQEVRSPGTYTIRWNAIGIASGMYFYRLAGENFSLTRKLVLTK